MLDEQFFKSRCHNCNAEFGHSSHITGGDVVFTIWSDGADEYTSNLFHRAFDNFDEKFAWKYGLGLSYCQNCYTIFQEKDRYITITQEEFFTTKGFKNVTAHQYLKVLANNNTSLEEEYFFRKNCFILSNNPFREPSKRHTDPFSNPMLSRKDRLVNMEALYHLIEQYRSYYFNSNDESLLIQVEILRLQSQFEQAQQKLNTLLDVNSYAYRNHLKLIQSERKDVACFSS